MHRPQDQWKECTELQMQWPTLQKRKDQSGLLASCLPTLPQGNCIQMYKSPIHATLLDHIAFTWSFKEKERSLAS